MGIFRRKKRRRRSGQGKRRNAPVGSLYLGVGFLILLGTGSFGAALFVVTIIFLIRSGGTQPKIDRRSAKAVIAANRNYFPALTGPRPTLGGFPNNNHISTRRFGNREFENLGELQIEREADGAVKIFNPHEQYRGASRAVLLQDGRGPFCRFRIAQVRHQAGLYVLVSGNQPVYVGETINLAKRWGSNGYGAISPRNCYEGGQSTNCRVNAAVLDGVQKGGRFELWFAQFDGPRDERLAAEIALIQQLHPPWNRKGRTH